MLFHLKSIVTEIDQEIKRLGHAAKKEGLCGAVEVKAVRDSCWRDFQCGVLNAQKVSDTSLKRAELSDLQSFKEFAGTFCKPVEIKGRIRTIHYYNHGVEGPRLNDRGNWTSSDSES